MIDQVAGQMKGQTPSGMNKPGRNASSIVFGDELQNYQQPMPDMGYAVPTNHENAENMQHYG